MGKKESELYSIFYPVEIDKNEKEKRKSFI
jgi:hypothetical protein